MFIKQRQVRQSRFTSRFARSSRKRREYAASVYATAVIQGFLVLFLSFGGVRGFGMMREKFPDLAWYLQIAVPLGMFLIAAIVLKSFIVNVRHAIELTRVERANRKTY